MPDPHPTFGPADAMAAISSRLVAQSDTPQCCCGRADCIFLKHNCSVLESVEKDVHAAAKMGQALLARHEAYMADAERDRTQLTDHIDLLEASKKQVEVDNARTIEENRLLLDQLEALNTTVADSEVRITSLEAALQSSQLSVRRLEGAANRAAQLERELEFLEREQEKLQSDLFSSQRDARTAFQRWKTAERGISNLQQQLEKMEQEVREERERHDEVIQRMERQHAMEKDLNTAAGRLKGATAVKSLGMDGGKSTNPVVSHFVRDLLQDNANLQLGMSELRELLMNSNDEIQMLREQLLYHQPVALEGEASATSTLRAELEDIISPEAPTSPRRNIHTHTPKLSQELHIHHHYHVKPETKKPKKKRQGLAANIFTPPSRSPSTPPSAQFRFHQPSPSPALLSHAHRDSVSTVPSNRWSLFSDNPSDIAPSSVPTSPRSGHRNSMLSRGVLEETFPNSPLTSAGPMSPPPWEYMHRKNASDASVQSFQQPSHFPPPPATRLVQHTTEDQRPVHSPQDPNFITDSDAAVVSTLEEVPDLTNISTATDDSTDDAASQLSSHPSTLGPQTLLPIITAPQHADEDDEDLRSILTPSTMSSQRRPRLYRAASHESIMSLSGGLDIHTLKSRPSQLTLRHVGSMAAAADTRVSTMTAQPTISAVGKRGSAVLRDNLAPWGLPMPRTRVVSGPNSPAASVAGSSSPDTTPRQSSALGRLAAWRPWGGATTSSPTVTISEQEATATVTTPTKSLAPPVITTAGPVVPAASKSPQERDFSRPTGINQAGAIPGFQEYFAAHARRRPPHKLQPDTIDREALREVLEDG